MFYIIHDFYFLDVFNGTNAYSHAYDDIILFFLFLFLSAAGYLPTSNRLSDVYNLPIGTNSIGLPVYQTSPVI